MINNSTPTFWQNNQNPYGGKTRLWKGKSINGGGGGGDGGGEGRGGGGEGRRMK